MYLQQPLKTIYVYFSCHQISRSQAKNPRLFFNPIIARWNIGRLQETHRRLKEGDDDSNQEQRQQYGEGCEQVENGDHTWGLFLFHITSSPVEFLTSLFSHSASLSSYTNTHFAVSYSIPYTST